MSFSSDRSGLVNQLPLSIDFPKDTNRFIEIFTDLYKRIVSSLNTKEGGLYSLEELYTFQQFFTQNNTQAFRNVYRSTFDVIAEFGGDVPPGTTVTFAHGITNLTTATRIYGTATTNLTPPTFLPIPYSSTTNVNKQIEVYMDTQNVYVITGSSQSTLTQCYIICEYLKS